eukprot:16451_5
MLRSSLMATLAPCQVPRTTPKAPSPSFLSTLSSSKPISHSNGVGCGATLEMLPVAGAGEASLFAKRARSWGGNLEELIALKNSLMVISPLLSLV